MSRKIKFRVWDIPNQCWSDLFHAITDDGALWHFPNSGLAERDDPEQYTVEQYTGLKDKNGKEIYEGCELDGRYRVEYIAPKFCCKDMVNGDIIELYENRFTITREHCEVSQDSERGIN